jgi:hypothetical protein
MRPDVVVHAYNPSIREVKARGSQVQDPVWADSGQPWLYSKTLSQKKKKINDLVNNKAHNESKVAKIVKFDLQ